MKDAPRDGTPINIRLRLPGRSEAIFAMRWVNGRYGERWYAVTNDRDNDHMDDWVNEQPPEHADWAPIIFED